MAFNRSLPWLCLICFVAPLSCAVAAEMSQVPTSDWKDVAVLCLTALGAVLSAIGAILWASLNKTRDELSAFKETVGRDYQRRDDTQALEVRLMEAIGEVKDLVKRLLDRDWGSR